MRHVAILGGGSWGTALAIVLSNAHQAHGISLWVRDATLAESLRRHRENPTYLPGQNLPETVLVTPDVQSALENASVVVGAVPAAHAREIYERVSPHLVRGTVIVSATKGLEPHTHLRMTEVISQVIPADHEPRVAVLSGPSFATEAAAGHPTAVVLASGDAALANELQEAFAGPSFRLYTNVDLLGVELAGAMKNVIAIASRK